MKRALSNGLTLTLVLASILLYGCAVQDTSPRALQGVLDLSRWDFEKDGIFALHSQWEFYWNRLLTPKDFSGGDLIENRAFFPVPGLWGGFQLRPSPYTGDGFATYRLRIKMDPGQRNLALQKREGSRLHS